MSTNRPVLEKWMKDAKTWESVFSANMPEQATMRTLMEEWSNLRQVTNQLCDAPAAIHGGDLFCVQAREFRKKAFSFFNMSSETGNDLPLQNTLAARLTQKTIQCAPDTPQLRLGLFKEDFPKLIERILEQKKAERIAEQQREQARQAERKQEQEQEQERIREQEQLTRLTTEVDTDPFYTAITTTVLDPLNNEIERIKAKNPDDIRLAALNDIKNTVETTITGSKAERIPDGNHPDKAITSKENCKTAIAQAIEGLVINNKTFDEHWSIKFGKILLNALIAIPVLIRSLVSDKTVSESFFSTKKQTYNKIERIKSGLDDLEVSPDTPKPGGPS